MAELVRELTRSGPLEQPGGGDTSSRLQALAAASHRSLSVGRLCEAHADGQSILLEAGVEPGPYGLLGVWASESASAPPLELRRVDGREVLRGPKAFCSGVPLVDHALVTCRRGQDRCLALVAIAQPAAQVCPSEWTAVGMRATQTRTVIFDDAVVEAVVGRPGWYLDRPGFWHGAVGVAASWFGGAEAVAATVRAGVKASDSHGLADLGEIEAAVYGMGAALDRAAGEIDADPTDRDAAQLRALAVRHLVAGGCLEVVARAGSALGPRAMAFDADHAQRIADLDVYVRQHHGRRDDEQLGRLAQREESSC